jgi:hypothetical protein
MVTKFILNSRLPKKWRLFFPGLFCLLFLAPLSMQAHQTPSTIVLLDVSPARVGMELQLPLPELELAFGHAVTNDPATVLERLGPQLKEYLKAHIHSYISKESPWTVEITNMKMDKGEQVASGPPYWELVVHLLLNPPLGETTRRFTLDYDVIMHEVINHAAFVSIRNDWETGNTGKQPAEVGVIRRDTKDNVIYPLTINLEKGNWWAGCRSMISLGMEHIKEGTDHLLFIIVLLLPAMLIPNEKRWGAFGGTRYSVARLLKIVTAFTIGHSITLLAGAAGWLQLPSKPVEIMIAFSILISAVHAVRPLFPGREAWVAAGFGLIHGLAFAGALANLQLDGLRLAASILGFNIGIELMQLAVILITVPWLMVLSRTSYYQGVRIGGAVLSAIAALAWITERASERVNPVTGLMQRVAPYAPWLIAALAVFAMSCFYIKRIPPAQPEGGL